MLLKRYQAADDRKAIALLQKISPVAWQHILFLGRYLFRDRGPPIDLEALLANSRLGIAKQYTVYLSVTDLPPPRLGASGLSWRLRSAFGGELTGAGNDEDGIGPTGSKYPSDARSQNCDNPAIDRSSETDYETSMDNATVRIWIAANDDLRWSPNPSSLSDLTPSGV